MQIKPFHICPYDILYLLLENITGNFRDQFVIVFPFFLLFLSFFFLNKIDSGDQAAAER